MYICIYYILVQQKLIDASRYFLFGFDFNGDGEGFVGRGSDDSEGGVVKLSGE